MTKKEKKELTDSLYRIINRAFIAEHTLQEQGLLDELKAKKITPEQYVMRIAEKLVTEVEQQEKDSINNLN